MKNIRNFYLKIFIFWWENFQYICFRNEAVDAQADLGLYFPHMPKDTLSYDTAQMSSAYVYIFFFSIQGFWY